MEKVKALTSLLEERSGLDVREAVLFQVGNRDDTGVDSEMCKEAAAVLEEYAVHLRREIPI